MSSTANINGYNLVTTPTGGAGSGNASSFLVTGLTPNTTYTLAVSSFNVGGQSDVSNITVTTLPNPPTDLSASVLSDTTASISFTASTGTAVINSYNLTSYPGYITASGGYSPITINGLISNTPYTFTATATNSQGTSSSSLPSNSITMNSSPNSPTNLSLLSTTPSSVTLSFTPVIGNINYYIATTSPGGFIGYSSGSPITISGLSPSTTYSISLQSVNNYGTSVASNNVSATTTDIITGTIFGAPTIGTVSSINTSYATISLTAPSGATINTIYSAYDGSGLLHGASVYPATSIFLGGFVSNTNYSISLKTSNSAGTSTASSSLIITTAPLPPTNLAIVSKTASSAIISFTPPSIGNAPITNYTIIDSSSGITGTSSATPITINGLSSNSTYYLTMTDTNTYNSKSSTSAPSSKLLLNTLLTAPTIGTASSITTTTAVIGFTSPNGTTSDTSFNAISGGIIYGSATFDVSFINVSGLSPNTIYPFTVNSVTSTNNSLASSSVSLTTIPGPPTSVSGTPVSDTAISVSCTAPSGTGSITSYKVTSNPGSITASGTTLPITITGLTANTAYTFTATATNSQGISVQSAPSNPITTNMVPNPPTNLALVSTSGSTAVISFTPPIGNLVGYIATTNTGIQGTSASSPLTIYGLASITNYTVSIVSLGTKGNSISSSTFYFTSGAAQIGTGGTVTNNGTTFFHTFTSSGTFTLPYPVTINILLVGGGGAGGTGSISGSFEGCGGGGGGGVAYGTKLIPAGTYNVTVGSGGVTATTSANFIINAIGGNSSFTNGSIINEIANGGSYGAAGCSVTTGGGGTGSGGGGGGCGGAKSGGTGSSSTAGISSGSTSMNLTFLANSGAIGGVGGGGGGGAGGVGQTYLGSSGGIGGQGFTWSITGLTYGGGGGGGAYQTPTGTLGGVGGSGGGGSGGVAYSGNGNPGTINTGGGGGGGAGYNGVGGAGGSGIVIISYISSALYNETNNGIPTQPIINSVKSTSTTITINYTSTDASNILVNSTYSLFYGSTIYATTTYPTKTIIATSLTPNTQYYFYLKATNTFGSSLPTTLINASTKLSPPTILGINSITTNSAIVEITPPTGASDGSYFDTSINGLSFGRNYYPKTTIYVAGLSPNTNYYITTIASNTNGVSQDSNGINITTLPNPPSTSYPYTIYAEVMSNTTVNVYFSPSSGNGKITSYNVTSNPGSITASGTASPVTVTGLTPNTSYTFTMYSVNNQGISTTTPSTVPITTNSFISPPTNLSVVSNTPTSITISFTPSNGSANFYIATANPGRILGYSSSSPITISGLSQNAIYSISLQAVDNYGTSTSSSSINTTTSTIITGTILSAPTLLTSSSIGTTYATILFTAPTGATTGTVYTAYDASGNIRGTNYFPATSIFLAGLTPNTNYSVSIKTSNKSGTSTASSSLIFATVSLSPINLSIVSKTSTSATIGFTGVGGNATVSQYTLITSPNISNVTGTSSPIVVTGLTPATTYNFSMNYTNSYSISVPSTFNPTSVTGLILWMDANDPNNTGVQPSNGSTITSWKDKSGGGRNATANTPITYNTTGLGGYPALTFTGSQWLTGNISNTNNTMTIFGVCSMSSSSAGSARIIGFSNGSGVDDYNNGGFMGFLRQGNTGIGPYRNGAFASQNPPSYSTPYLFECWYDGTNEYATVQIGNTTSITSAASSGNFAITYYTICNNTRTTDTGGPFYGFMSEILVYNTSLSTTDRQKIEGYLSWKWGIQGKLPSTHPYYSVSPTSPTNSTVYTTSASSSTISTTTPLSAPIITGSTNNTANSTYIVFTPPSGFTKDTIFNLYSSTTLIGTIDYSKKYFDLSGLTPNTIYPFTMTAMNSYGTSPSSNLYYLTTLASKPSNILVISSTTNTIILSFTGSSGNNTIIYTSNIGIGYGTPSSFVISGLSTNTAYSLSIIARNSGGFNPSNFVNVSTVLPAPILLAVVGSTYNSITFNFTPSLYADTSTYYSIRSGGLSYGTASNQVTTITGSGLTSNTQSNFTLVAINNNGTSSPSNSVSGITAPSPPINIVATTISNTIASINLTPPPGIITIISYTVTSSPSNITATGSSLPIIITGLSSNTQYTFTVTALNIAGRSPPSSSSNSITTNSVPNPPTDLIKIASTESSITIGFTPPIGTITSYLATTDSGETGTSSGSPITISGLTSNSPYNITIQSIDSYGTSFASSQISSGTAPNPPTNLISTSNTLTSIGLSFTPPSGNILSYGYYAIDISSTLTPFTGTISAEATFYTINSLISGYFYNIKLNTVGTYGTSVYSSILNYYTLLSPPTGLTGTSNTISSVTFSFTPPTGIVNNYTYTAIDSNSNIFTGSVSAPASSITITGLSTGTSYNITLIASNQFTTSASSTTLVYSTQTTSVSFSGYDIIASIGNYTIAGYLNPTTINNAITLSGVQTIYILAIAGGGGGAGYVGGGGGAGGFVQKTVSLSTSDNINITVGAGGLANGGYGSNSQNGGSTTVTFTTNTINNINAVGGGGGGSYTGTVGALGGSGGGGGSKNGTAGALGGAGTSGQGNAGGQGASSYLAGGGGGAASAGGSLTGGNGSLCNLTGISSLYPSIYWAGGGGGSTYGTATIGGSGTGSGGSGGGGTLGRINSNLTGLNYAPNVGGGGASSAGNNTGSGGGGDGTGGGGGSGGSGIVLVATLTSNISQIPSKYYYYYTGSDQIVPIPSGFTRATIQCWGAGGATQGRGTNTFYNTGAGGGGGYTSATFTITGYTGMKVVVGQGGISRQNGVSAQATYGGGGGQPLNNASWGSASGGGRSAVQLLVLGTYTEIITSGGGGGGGGSPVNTASIGTGGGGGGTTGGNAYRNTSEGGSGGTQTTGGLPNQLSNGGGTNGTSGTQFTGGSGGTLGAGGGGGYYGGGGGAFYSTGGFGGGGGGSSYINTTYQTASTAQTITQGTAPTVANNAGLPTYFQNKIGNGGAVTSSIVVGQHGQHGFVIITYQ